MNRDDLKPTGRSGEQFRNEITTVETVSNNIKLEFELQACVIISLKFGKFHRKQHTRNSIEKEI
jgi:hypothetical protein